MDAHDRELNNVNIKSFDYGRKRWNFLAILCAFVIVITALICVVIYLGIEASQCSDSSNIHAAGQVTAGLIQDTSTAVPKCTITTDNEASIKIISGAKEVDSSKNVSLDPLIKVIGGNKGVTETTNSVTSMTTQSTEPTTTTSTTTATMSTTTTTQTTSEATTTPTTTTTQTTTTVPVTTTPTTTTTPFTTTESTTETPPPTAKIMESELFGTVDGEEIYKYTLKNTQNVEVSVINYGGIITNILVPDRYGNQTDITLGYDTLEEYTANPLYFGAIIGRYANRVANGQFIVDGATYNINKFEHWVNSIHGGTKGFDKRIWTASLVDEKVLVLEYVSEDGEEGFPGELTVQVTYQLTNDNELKIDYSATTTKKTIINLSSHSYFNLGGHDSGKIFDHDINIFAEKYTPLVGSHKIPKGNILLVDGKKYDLREKKNLGKVIPLVPGGEGFDINYSFGKTGWRKYMARVEHPPSGRYLELYSTEPGLQFHTAYHLNEISGKNGAVYEQYGGFILEAQHYPDSPNKPNFPTTFLAPGEVYLQSTIIKFGSE